MMALNSLSRLSEFLKKQFITTINTTAVRNVRLRCLYAASNGVLFVSSGIEG